MQVTEPAAVPGASNGGRGRGRGRGRIVKKTQSYRDSHNAIEKRRRDRINASLRALARLVPECALLESASSDKGKLDKADILQYTVQHLERQQQSDPSSSLLLPSAKQPHAADTPASSPGLTTSSSTQGQPLTLNTMTYRDWCQLLIDRDRDLVHVFCLISGEILHVSHACLATLGYSTPAEVLQLNALQWIHPDDLDSVMAHVKTAMLELLSVQESPDAVDLARQQDGGVAGIIFPASRSAFVDLWYRLRSKSGSYQQLQVRARLVLFPGSGAPMTGSAEQTTGHPSTGISPRSSATPSSGARSSPAETSSSTSYMHGPLTRAEPTLVLVALGRPMGVQQHKPDPQPGTGQPITAFTSRLSLFGIFEYVSSLCKPLVGFGAEELIGQSIYLFCHPDDVLAFSQMLGRVLGNPNATDVVVVRFRFVTKEGPYVWMTTKMHVKLNSVTQAPECIVCLNTPLLDANAATESGAMAAPASSRSKPLEQHIPTPSDHHLPGSASSMALSFGFDPHMTQGLLQPTLSNNNNNQPSQSTSSSLLLAQAQALQASQLGNPTAIQTLQQQQQQQQQQPHHPHHLQHQQKVAPSQFFNTPPNQIADTSKGQPAVHATVSQSSLMPQPFPTTGPPEHMLSGLSSFGLDVNFFEPNSALLDEALNLSVRNKELQMQLDKIGVAGLSGGLANGLQPTTSASGAPGFSPNPVDEIHRRQSLAKMTNRGPQRFIPSIADIDKFLVTPPPYGSYAANPGTVLPWVQSVQQQQQQQQPLSPFPQQQQHQYQPSQPPQSLPQQLPQHLPQQLPQPGQQLPDQFASFPQASTAANPGPSAMRTPALRIQHLLGDDTGMAGMEPPMSQWA
ncbi:hypothetical protein CAOG_006106 [Capsaspora owczarzaki ATCC 30864]|uniref:Uncharacterized protein n=2 Tax=Capsaspora owczarzaki (strain ATCC 30864) TaxID=595528 RepID=A0A0D2X497_CAPO3|nr:hypothetical protein CAOG_006106 [Capsaspora owczarzaki ATCC 30864]